MRHRTPKHSEVHEKARSEKEHGLLVSYFAELEFEPLSFCLLAYCYMMIDIGCLIENLQISLMLYYVY